MGSAPNETASNFYSPLSRGSLGPYVSMFPSALQNKATQHDGYILWNIHTSIGVPVE
jgi:hypothetical protein